MINKTKVYYGEEGCIHTCQDHFLKEIRCEKCGAPARITMTVSEQIPEQHERDKIIYATDLYHKDDRMWIHDICSVAIYFCPQCLHASVEWNQF
jgi:hypothetical protein